MFALLLGALLLAGPNACAQVPPTAAESPATTIGEIIGPDFTVKGQVEITSRVGRAVTRLVSGNEVTVRHGQALLRLENDAGSIRLCQAMRASLLKSAAGLTVAFDIGTLRIELRGPEMITLHTPWFTISSPRAEENPARSLLASLDAQGKLCLKTSAGEWIVREQLTNAQLAVPAGNEYLIEPDKLTTPQRATDACSCPEEDLEEIAPAARPAVESQAATDAAVKTAPGTAEAKPQEPVKSSPPEWKAIMPPLVYDAKSAGAPPAEAASETPAILVPATWQGVVTPRAASPSEFAAATAPRGGFVDRVKNFFRALFGRPKRGSGSH